MPRRARPVLLAVAVGGCVGDAPPASESVTSTSAEVRESTTAPNTTATTAPLDATTTTEAAAVPSAQDATALAAIPEMPPDAIPLPADPEPDASRGAALAAVGGADFTPAAGGASIRIQEGVTLVVEGRAGTLLAVETPCETRGTVDVSEVALVPAATSDGAWATAVFVIDAGHGGPVNTGAQGPGGLWERDANIDIVRRIAAMLSAGVVLAGEELPRAGGVVLSRRSGPADANYEAGTGFRARLANALDATALVSVHNNAGTTERIAFPGSEAFYRNEDADSRRLAGLMVEEFRAALGAFDVAWVGAPEAGARYRLNAEGLDYYSLLRTARVPAIIAEGAYVSNPEEEALLRTSEFRQAYANAVVRALYRFVTTDDPGSFFNGAFQPASDVPPGGARPDCILPVQE